MLNTSLTNILPYSQQMKGASWSGYAISTTVNSGTAPDGSDTAATVSSTSSTTPGYVIDQAPNPALYDQSTVTASVYLRSLSGTIPITVWIVEAVGASVPVAVLLDSQLAVYRVP
jgi:hypothetical protein